MSLPRFGFIGAGNMGGALMQGVLAAGWSPDRLAYLELPERQHELLDAAGVDVPMTQPGSRPLGPTSASLAPARGAPLGAELLLAQQKLATELRRPAAPPPQPGARLVHVTHALQNLLASSSSANEEAVSCGLLAQLLEELG